jgi:hypothetical protein
LDQWWAFISDVTNYISMDQEIYIPINLKQF